MASTTLTSIVFILVLSSYSINSQSVDCDSNNNMDRCECPSSNPSNEDETCILDCSNSDNSCKSKSLYCRANDPCNIKCDGNFVCNDLSNINASTATNVNITCNGYESCNNIQSIHCGTGHCQISCHGNTSCQNIISINTSQSISFQCTGNCLSSNIPPAFNHHLPTTFPSIFQTTMVPSTQTTLVATHEPTIAAAPTATKVSAPDSPQDQNDVVIEAEGNLIALFLDSLSDPLVLVILGLILVIFLLCCTLFCWVCISHRQTQKLIQEQQRRLDSRSFHDHINSELKATISLDAYPFSKSTSVEVPLTDITPITPIDQTVRMSPTPGTVAPYSSASRQSIAAPRMYRLHSIDAAKTAPPALKEENHEKNTKKLHKPKPTMTDETTLSHDEDTTVSTNDLKETWEVEFDHKAEEKDGEVTTTGRSSKDVFELMTKLMRQNSNSTALPGQHGHMLYNHPLYHPPFNVPPPPMMRKYNSASILSQQSTRSLYRHQPQRQSLQQMPNLDKYQMYPMNVPPPPPIMKNNNYQPRGSPVFQPPPPPPHPQRPQSQSAMNLHSSMQHPLHTERAPTLSKSRSYNEQLATHHHTNYDQNNGDNAHYQYYRNGMFYGYAAAIHYMQQIQHQHANKPSTILRKGRTSTFSKMKYLTPHLQEFSGTFTNSHTEMSELSKNSTLHRQTKEHNDTVILHINSSDCEISSGEEHENSEEDTTNAVHRAKSPESSRVVRMSHNEDSDGYDTHTNASTALSDTRLTIQISTNSHHNIHGPKDRNSRPQTQSIELPHSPFMQLNVSQPIHQLEVKEIMRNDIPALPEQDEIEIVESKQDTLIKAKSQQSDSVSTPEPTENFVKDEMDESTRDSEQESITKSFGLQLVDNDESIFGDVKSTSTVIEDTYLKYLNTDNKKYK